jgi:hypothetical protein
LYRYDESDRPLRDALARMKLLETGDGDDDDDYGGGGGGGGGCGGASSEDEVGRCTLTPPDPQLKGAWYPGGFKPLPLNINPGFIMCLSKCNVHRYDEDDDDDNGEEPLTDELLEAQIADLRRRIAEDDAMSLASSTPTPAATRWDLANPQTPQVKFDTPTSPPSPPIFKPPGFSAVS